MTKDNDQDFASMFAASEAQRVAPRRKKLQVGDTVRGRIVAIASDAIFVDIGAKAEAMIDRLELSDPQTGAPTCAVGDEVEARVVEVDGKNGCPVLRRSSVRSGEGVAALAEALATGLPVEGKVTAVKTGPGGKGGGFEISIGAVRAFCPLSQIDLRPVPDPTALVGQKFRFLVTRYEEGGRNVVVSRRTLLEEEQAVQAKVTWETLKVGAVVKGKVSSLQAFGAFVDLGGIEGLIHVSEMGYQRVGHPSEALGVGQDVEVEITKLERGADRKSTRISLSLRALQEDPWLAVASKFGVGTRAKGKAVRLDTFGAFVELAPGVDGLLHVSQLREHPKAGGRQLRHAKDVLGVGEELDVVILEVDRERRRLSLGLATGEEDESGPAPTEPAKSFGTFGDLLAKAKPSKGKKA